MYAYYKIQSSVVSRKHRKILETLRKSYKVAKVIQSWIMNLGGFYYIIVNGTADEERCTQGFVV